MKLEIIVSNGIEIAIVRRRRCKILKNYLLCCLQVYQASKNEERRNEGGILELLHSTSLKYCKVPEKELKRAKEKMDHIRGGDTVKNCNWGQACGLEGFYPRSLHVKRGPGYEICILSSFPLLFFPFRLSHFIIFTQDNSVQFKPFYNSPYKKLIKVYKSNLK